VVRLRRPGAIGDYVLVEQHRDATGVEIAAPRDVGRFQVMMPQRAVGHLFWFPLFDQLDIADARGRTQVIHDRVRFIETLRGENVLVGDALVLIGRPLPVAVKPDVMFPRDFSQSLIIRHYRLLSLVCHSEPSEESLISGFFTVYRVKSRRSEML